MPTKQELIKLEYDKSQAGGKEKTGTGIREVTLQHAANILSYEKKIGKIRHKLPTNSNYEFTENGEIIKRTGK